VPLGTEMMADFLVSGKILSSFLVDNNKSANIVPTWPNMTFFLLSEFFDKCSVWS